MRSLKKARFFFYYYFVIERYLYVNICIAKDHEHLIKWEG